MLSKIKGFFAKLFTNAPTWAQEASTVLKLSAPLVESIVELTAGDAGAAAVKAVIAEVQSDMVAAANFLNDAHSGSTSGVPSIQGLVSAISNDIGSLLTAGHIKDTKTLADVTAVVQTISGELSTILGLLPSTAKA